jgi:hypothetical protein
MNEVIKNKFQEQNAMMDFESLPDNQTLPTLNASGLKQTSGQKRLNKPNQDSAQDILVVPPSKQTKMDQPKMDQPKTSRS